MQDIFEQSIGKKFNIKMPGDSPGGDNVPSRISLTGKIMEEQNQQKQKKKGKCCK